MPVLQFLYKPFILLPDLSDYNQKIIEVRVLNIFLTKFNRAVQQRQFFGNDLYTSDSDIVCILQHQAKLNLTDRVPTQFEGVSVFFKVNRVKNTYPSVFKNGIKSQKKTGYEGNSIKFEGVEFLSYFGDEKDLLKMAQLMPNRRDNEVSIRRLLKQSHKKKIQLSKLAEIAKREVWPAMVFNLSIEPAFRFNLCVFGDKSN